jgi:hypothetical protein
MPQAKGCKGCTDQEQDAKERCGSFNPGCFWFGFGCHGPWFILFQALLSKIIREQQFIDIDLMHG